ncbi:cell envelope biogenesis protein OmpA [Streptomyces sp. NPDC046831]|uniref:cell envelope biogenesis protein OmpA n=1 Tax=Streptomyces sp. NPDC046831 TaxID=3154805 RepID=UPI0033FE7E95
MLLPHRSRSAAPLIPTGADLLRIISDPGTPVFLTVHADGRRRYSYWQPHDPRTGKGSCYVSLPTAACDMLHSSGRIALGEPLTDPARTIYRVRSVRTPAVRRQPARPTPRHWTRAA